MKVIFGRGKRSIIFTPPIILHPFKKRGVYYYYYLMVAMVVVIDIDSRKKQQKINFHYRNIFFVFSKIITTEYMKSKWERENRCLDCFEAKFSFRLIPYRTKQQEKKLASHIWSSILYSWNLVFPPCFLTLFYLSNLKKRRKTTTKIAKSMVG